MENCFQTEGMSILQHGQSVWEHTRKLILGDFKEFVLPEWFTTNHHFIVNNLCDWETIREYNTMHDCGKPFCLEIDSEGKRHFPNHAEISKQTYLEVFPERVEVAELIGLDMLLHTSNYEQIQNLNLPNKILATLIVTAFAEIHSNAKMFGGTDSVSFKIKYKKLDRVGKRIVENLSKHQDAYSYIVTRKNIPIPAQIVQSCHAAWEAAKYRHPSLVVLEVKSEEKLKQLMTKLVDSNIQFYIFREPIINNEITAICTEPLIGEQREILKKYQLWKG